MCEAISVTCITNPTAIVLFFVACYASVCQTEKTHAFLLAQPKKCQNNVLKIQIFPM